MIVPSEVDRVDRTSPDVAAEALQVCGQGDDLAVLQPGRSALLRDAGGDLRRLRPGHAGRVAGDERVAVRHA